MSASSLLQRLTETKFANFLGPDYRVHNHIVPRMPCYRFGGHHEGYSLSQISPCNISLTVKVSHFVYPYYQLFIQ